MSDEPEQPPLVPPPVNSPVAIRELKLLFLLVAGFLVMVFISLAVEGSLAFVYDAILLALCLAMLFPRN
jgi:hypothetical protein